jgi:hypothetical protein
MHRRALQPRGGLSVAYCFPYKLCPAWHADDNRRCETSNLLPYLLPLRKNVSVSTLRATKTSAAPRSTAIRLSPIQQDLTNGWGCTLHCSLVRCITSSDVLNPRFTARIRPTHRINAANSRSICGKLSKTCRSRCNECRPAQQLPFGHQLSFVSDRLGRQQSQCPAPLLLAFSLVIANGQSIHSHLPTPQRSRRSNGKSK